MAEHTPGPLMLCGCDGGASGDQRWIHLCPLHTAAPDLLAALEEIDSATGWAGLGDTVAVHIHNLARIAIAKAKGEQNAT